MGLQAAQIDGRLRRMTKRDVPEEWMPVLQARGFEGPQEIANAIAAAGGKTHVTTVGKFLDGEGVASAITVRAVADALKITEDRARKIRAEVIANQSGLETFHLKAEAAMLTTGQRRIVEGLVDEFIALQEKVSGLNRPAHRSATGRLGKSAGDDAKARARDAEFGDAADSFKRDTEKRRNGDSSSGTG